MPKISTMDELDIICGRAMGQTYEDLVYSTGHGNSTISRVLKSENLVQHVTSLFCLNSELIRSERFYKKWLAITFGVWGLATAINLAIYFIF